MDTRTEIENQLGGPLTEYEWQGIEAAGDAQDIALDLKSVDDIAKRVRTQRRAIRPSRTSISPEVDVDAGEIAPEGQLSERAELLATVYVKCAAAYPGAQELKTQIAGTRRGRNEEALADWIDRQYFKALGVSRKSGKAAMAAVESLRAKGEDLVEILDHRWVPATSLLGQATILAEDLADMFMWDPDDALRWLVCGGDAPVPWFFSWEMNVTHNHLARNDWTDTLTRLTLRLDPTLKPEEVAAYYSQIRSFYLEGERLRSLDGKALALARFYLERQDNPTGWDGWRRRWNAGPGERVGQKYRGDAVGLNSFRRAVQSAYERLVWVGWWTGDEDPRARDWEHPDAGES